MTEAEQFAMCDAYEGNTMIVFSDKPMAMRYALHRHETRGQKGIMVGVEDTRTGTGLYVMWRDRIPPDKVWERLANCRWLLERTLAGEHPKPQDGKVSELWVGGWPGER
jgi:hypothetical protein